jgi:hypothetical protein
MPQQDADFAAAGWKFYSFGGCAGFEQDAHGIG